jgi:hypothetical protein
MHASAQPLPRVRRIEFINQLSDVSAPFTAIRLRRDRMAWQVNASRERRPPVRPCCAWLAAS